MKKVLVTMIVLLLVVSCVFALAACNNGDNGSTNNGSTNSGNTAKAKLTLATNAAFAPYEYKIGNKFYGIDMEIAKIIAKELDMDLVISDMEFDSVVTSVQQGDADIALACLTVNAKREKSVTFSEAYEEGAAQVLIVKKSVTDFDSCSTVDAINAVFSGMGSKANIGVQAGTTGEAYVKGDVDWGFAGVPNSEASSYSSIGQAVDDIKNGSIQYAIVDKATANTLATANPDDIKIINMDLTVEKYAIGVNKNKPELLTKINAVIQKIKADGTLQAIYDAYADININEDADQGSAPNSTVYVGIEG